VREASVLDSDIDYCLDRIRRFDRDRALTVLVAPGKQAADLAVLYAFNLELATIQDSVTEPMLARIRLQWWREAVAELYAGRPRRHAVLTPLAAINAGRPLGRRWLDRLIDAREAELDAEPPADLDALARHAEATSGSLLALAAEAAGLDAEAGDVMALTRQVGTAFALAGIARATLHLARHRRTLLPRAVLQAHDVSLDRLYELKAQPGLAPAVATIADRARAELAAARLLRAPASLVPALRVGTLARAALKRLERHDHDLFDPKSVEASPLDIWRLFARKLTGTW